MFEFSDNFIWIGGSDFSLLLRDYMQLAVNVLTSSPKISELTKSAFFQIRLAPNIEEVG